MTRMGREAILWALSQTRWSPPGMCQQFTRMSFGVGSGFPSAQAAWDGAQKKHPTKDRNSVPPGVPVYFAGGSKGYGHAAVSLGKGLVRSTDWPSAYAVGTARITDLERSWGQRFLGWTEDVNGVTVWEKPKQRTPHITSALRLKDDDDDFRRSLRHIVADGDKGAAAVAKAYLEALDALERNRDRRKVLRERLRRLEVR